MEQALWRWDADKIGIPDYALESSGKSRLHFLLCLINWVFFFSLSFAQYGRHGT